MTLIYNEVISEQIIQDGEEAYPEEGAGFLLGIVEEGEQRKIVAILPVSNFREERARHNRYLISPKAMFDAEQEADYRGLVVLGVYHSHPDHPSRPSDFDREWAMPWFSYIITSVEAGKAVLSQSWRLRDDRSAFEEERLIKEQISIA